MQSHFMGKLLETKEKELKVKEAREKVYENNKTHWTTFASDTTDDRGKCKNILKCWKKKK